MNITVKFFASLREQIGQSEATVNTDEAVSVMQIWQQASGQQEMPENTLCAIDMEYVNPNTIVSHDAEVAFFPPVTGG